MRFVLPKVGLQALAILVCAHLAADGVSQAGVVQYTAANCSIDWNDSPSAPYMTLSAGAYVNTATSTDGNIQCNVSNPPDLDFTAIDEVDVQVKDGNNDASTGSVSAGFYARGATAGSSEECSTDASVFADGDCSPSYDDESLVLPISTCNNNAGQAGFLSIDIPDDDCAQSLVYRYDVTY